MNLYLKYRPKTVDELDLSGVRKTLNEMMTANNLAHAYLLTGPRGAGKTSTARVLARIVNCEHNDKKLGEPCNDCDACKSILDGSAMDVIEIDAASNRGIDDIRELKEKIRLAPSILKTKVYIIDEVHMLTTEAFNALLKTLEEPPSHSLFILCTTELHKVPETIVSRCVQIQFTKATPEEMKRSFARVVKGEGKKVDEEALEYLAKSVDGSFRDGVKILDQVLSNSDTVMLGDIELVVSGSANYKVTNLVKALAEKDVSKSLTLLKEAVTNGVDLTYLLVSLMRGLRDKLLTDEMEIGVTKLIFALDEVARRLATSLDGELLIQVAIVEWCGQDENNSPITNPPILKSKTSTVNVTKSSDHSPKTAQGSELKEPLSTLDASDVWKQVLLSLGQNNLALDTILSKAKPGKIQGDELTIYVQYDFHKQQLMSEKNLVKLEDIITRAVGSSMKVKVEISANSVVSGHPPTLEATEGLGDGTIEDAIAIFS
ncbi:DNA polymerase III subunit gamma/tau [Candidatus Woesebacteria bacterium]|nr:DNA polymerase III subunit gamma/tau [Candidatus Woesebacteria bacterium]